eukprot:2179742-Rhodomonas_salina.1
MAMWLLLSELSSTYMSLKMTRRTLPVNTAVASGSLRVLCFPYPFACAFGVDSLPVLCTTLSQMCACSVEYSAFLTRPSVPSVCPGFVCVLGWGWGGPGTPEFLRVFVCHGVSSGLKTRSHVIGHVTGALVRLYRDGVRASCLFDFKRRPGAG